MHCQNCKEQLPDNSTFCAYCGVKQDSAQPVSQLDIEQITTDSSERFLSSQLQMGVIAKPIGRKFLIPIIILAIMAVVIAGSIILWPASLLEADPTEPQSDSLQVGEIPPAPVSTQTGETAPETPKDNTGEALLSEIQSDDDSIQPNQLITTLFNDDGKLPFIADSAGLLTDTQLQELIRRAKVVSEKYPCEIRIIIVDDMVEYGFALAEEMNNHIYSEFSRGYGSDKSCLIFLMSMADHDYDLKVWGEYGITTFSAGRVDVLLDDYVLPFLKDDNYNEALSALLDMADTIQSDEKLVNEQTPQLVSVDKTPSNITERESNDRPDQASIIEMGQSITGNLSNSYKSERDWYIFSVPSGQYAAVTLNTLEQDSGSSYWDFYLYTEADIAPMNTPAGLAKQGAALAWGADPFIDIPTLYHQNISGNDTSTKTDALSKGTYYIRLESSDLHSKDEYTIQLSESSGGEIIRDYTLVSTYLPSENITTYERVYDDGYRESISEQGYYADLTRGYIDWIGWGKTPGSISALDLAILANLSNKTYDEAIQIIVDTFPDRSPPRQYRLIHNIVLSVNYCVFPIDDDHAIVSFGGTEDLFDTFADAELLFGLFVGQAIIANNIVRDLPYKTILITGYSLGGYLAADVRLNQKNKVTECIVFNAPGRSSVNAIGRVFGGKDTRINNYAAIGDKVHTYGLQPGNVLSVAIAPEAVIMGPLGKHDIQDIINAFIGKQSDFSFSYSNPIEQQGVIHFDKWSSTQHTGEFLDKDRRAFVGVGMYTEYGRSGTSFVKYKIPVSANKFTTYISLDSIWCGTTTYGTSTFQIFFDGELVFSDSYTETFSAEFIELQIPQNAGIITLQVQQNAGSRGNHACFFGNPMFLT